MLKGTLLGLERLFRLYHSDLVPTWTILVVYSYGSVLICKLLAWKICIPEGTPIVVLNILFHTVFAVGGAFLVFIRNMPIIPTGFLLAEIAVLFMKSYSFFHVNREAAIIISKLFLYVVLWPSLQP